MNESTHGPALAGVGGSHVVRGERHDRVSSARANATGHSDVRSTGEKVTAINGGNCAHARRRVSLGGMAPNPTRELLLHLLRSETLPPYDVDALATLAEIVVGQMDVGPQDFDVALAIAHQHLADIRSELIEAERRSADL